jgi:redox-sensitive bicupin YhaK (pirin superfamily)
VTSARLVGLARTLDVPRRRSLVRNHAPLTLVEIDLKPGTTVVQDLPGSYNGFVHVIQGEGRFGTDHLTGRESQTLWLDSADPAAPSALAVTADTALRVLVAAGEPLHAPVAARGPFVMNTLAEIEQAYADLAAGRFDA